MEHDPPALGSSATFVLLRHALAGDGLAQDELFDKLRRELVEAARRHALMPRLATSTSVEDLAGDVLVRCFQRGSLDKFRDQGRGSLRRFLVVVLDGVIVERVRQACTLRRGEGRAPRDLEDVVGGTEEPAAPGPSAPTVVRLADLVNVCCSRLSHREARIWRLWAADHRSPADIAGLLGTSQDAVRSALRRANLKLAKYLDLGSPA